MAQLVVAAAGAAIGGLIGGPTGAQIGWAIGSAIGSSMGPAQKQRGPRLEDLRVTGSEYGQPIPYVQGHPRVAGQIWWASDKRAIATTTESGGKGGPSIETTTYTYEVDLLIGLSDNPIQGVSRVWSNGKMVWTKRDDSGTASALSGKSQTNWRRMTVYPGGPDQLPDPTYEAAVSDAPAYRGRGTVFIEGLQLGSSGQLPNLTFELYTEGTEEGRSATLLATFPSSFYSNGAGGVAFDIPAFNVHVLVGDSNSSTVQVWGFSLGTEEPQLQGSYSIFSNQFRPAPSFNTDESGMFVMRAFFTGSPNYAYRYTDDGTAYVFELPYNQITATDPIVMACKSGADMFLGDGNTGGFAQRRVWRYSATGGAAGTTSAALPAAVRSLCATPDHVYVLNAPTLSGASTNVYVLDRSTLALVDTIPVPVGSSVSRAGEVMADALGNVYLYEGSDEFWRLDGTAWTLVKQFGSVSGGDTIGGNRAGIVGGDLFVLEPTVASGSSIVPKLYAVFDAVQLTEPTVQEVVDGLLARTGIAAGKVDTTALSTISTPVRGLAVGQVSATRSVLEQMGAAFFFESYLADKLYFVPRGGSSAATIPYAALGATDGSEVDDPLGFEATPDEEIPARVSLTYANADGDYNVATEHSDRLLSNLTTTSTVQLPLALTAAEAKGIADAMVQDGYASRLSGTVHLDGRYLARTPTDVVTLTDDDGSTYRARLVRRRQQGLRVEWDWISEDATALASAGVTTDDYTPSLSVSLPGPTALVLMDMPILRDADNSPGIYAAAKPADGTSTNWPGARLMGSTGGDYADVATFTSRAIFGETTVALTNWTGGNVFDEGGSVTVNVGSGTLASATRDALLNDDANAMLVGAEVIQFRTATLVTAGVYKLTGLLRGRRGTEHAMTGHTVGETCVLLRTTGLLRHSYDAARIGVASTYKAVTLGKTLSSATARAITDTGVALKPFAPVNLRKSTSTAGATVLTWDRRSRLSYRWPSTGSLPLGEAAEHYVVELRDGGSVLTDTVTVTEPSVTFTGSRNVSTWAQPVRWLLQSGGKFYGTSGLRSGGDKFLVECDAAGNVTQTSDPLGDDCRRMVLSGGYLFVLAGTGTGASATAQSIRKFDPADLSTVLATYTVPTAGDAVDFYADGTSLWVTLFSANDLVQLAMSDLSVTSTTAMGEAVSYIDGDGTWLYLQGAGYFAYEPGGSPAEKWRTTIFANPQHHYRSGYLYTNGFNEVVVLDATDGSEVERRPISLNGFLLHPSFVNVSGYVACVDLAGVGHFFLAADGTYAFSAQLGNAQFLAGSDGGTLYTLELNSSGTDHITKGWELVPDLTGYTATVYQISATVGRGYPASITL